MARQATGLMRKCWHRWEPLRHAVLRVLAAALLVVYLGWQVFWLAQGQIPPALFLALTGLPAPTTGGTRAVLHFSHGEWRESLACNPMALPITLLAVASLAAVVATRLRRGRWRLPRGFGAAWLAVLVIAWVLKLLFFALHIGPRL